MAEIIFFGADNNDFWVVKTDEYGIILEFPSWIIPPILMMLPFGIVLKKKIFRSI